PGDHGRNRLTSRGPAQSRSALVERDRIASTISVGVIRPATTSSTYWTSGASTPLAAASARSDEHDFAPSATWFVVAMIPAVVSPMPRRSPKVRLRDSGEEQVATRSPRPARPISVNGSAPSVIASRAVSARPRVITEAVELSPYPRPTAIPTASATTFLYAPPISHPRTSVEVYGRNVGECIRSWSRQATDSSAQATTDAAGSRRAISLARLGPLTTAIR